MAERRKAGQIRRRISRRADVDPVLTLFLACLRLNTHYAFEVLIGLSRNRFCGYRPVADGHAGQRHGEVAWLLKNVAKRQEVRVHGPLEWDNLRAILNNCRLVIEVARGYFRDAESARF